jgi:hypothetical protein
MPFVCAEARPFANASVRLRSAPCRGEMTADERLADTPGQPSEQCVACPEHHQGIPAAALAKRLARDARRRVGGLGRPLPRPGQPMVPSTGSRTRGRERIGQAFEALPDSQHAVVTLRDVAGQPETADPPSPLRKHLVEAFRDWKRTARGRTHGRVAPRGSRELIPTPAAAGRRSRYSVRGRSAF